MPQKSLGLIETAGLAAAIEAADTAVKSANVVLLGYEFARGGGYTTIKVEGDVGAVKAAVSAAAISAAKVGRVVGTRVIARPADVLVNLSHNGVQVRNEAVFGTKPPKAPKGPEDNGPAPTSPAPKEGSKAAASKGKTAVKATVKAPGKAVGKAEKPAPKPAAKAEEPKAAASAPKSAAPLPEQKPAAPAPAAPVVPTVPQPPIPPAPEKPEGSK